MYTNIDTKEIMFSSNNDLIELEENGFRPVKMSKPYVPPYKPSKASPYNISVEIELNDNIVKFDYAYIKIQTLDIKLNTQYTHYMKSVI